MIKLLVNNTEMTKLLIKLPKKRHYFKKLIKIMNIITIQLYEMFSLMLLQ